MRPSSQISFVNCCPQCPQLKNKNSIFLRELLWDYKEMTCKRLRSLSGSEYILVKCFLSLSCSSPVMIPSCCCMQWHWSLGPVSTPFSFHLCEDTVRRWPSASHVEVFLQKPTPVAPWFWACSLQNCVCCLSDPVWVFGFGMLAN